MPNINVALIIRIVVVVVVVVVSTSYGFSVGGTTKASPFRHVVVVVGGGACASQQQQSPSVKGTYMSKPHHVCFGSLLDDNDDARENDNDRMNKDKNVAPTQQQQPPPQKVPTMIRIFSGDDGQSHIDSAVPMEMNPFLDREGAYGLGSVLEKAEGITFRMSPAGYELRWHCAPRRQYMILLRGMVELEVGDGTKVQAGPGDVILAEDLTGQGHITRVIGDEPRFYAIVPLSEQKVQVEEESSNATGRSPEN